MSQVPPAVRHPFGQVDAAAADGSGITCIQCGLVPEAQDSRSRWVTSEDSTLIAEPWMRTLQPVRLYGSKSRPGSSPEWVGPNRP